MAMVVQHNIAAQLALGELNKNNDQLRKSLEKVSSGQKIIGAKDDASSYVISEKMREMVRTLDQDHQNVQNGSALFKIVDGGINSIVDELRNLKELAINAANDTNTDQDRATIQREFDQRRANIDDIATTTNYNGKVLMDGTYYRPNTQTLTDVLSYLYQTYEYDYDDDGAIIDKRIVTGVGGTVDSKNIYTNGVTGMFKLNKVTAQGKDAATVSWVNGREVYGNPATGGGKGYSANNWLKLDFTSMEKRNGGTLNIPNDLHKQGFSIFCSDYDFCPSFHGFMFDSTKPVGTGEKVYNTSGPVYIVGISGVGYTSSRDTSDTPSTWSTITDEERSSISNNIAAAIFSGVLDAISKDEGAPEYVDNVSSDTDIIHLAGYGDEVELKCQIDEDGNATYSIMQHYNMWIFEGYDTGAVYSKPLPPTADSGGSIIDPSYISDVEEKATKFNPLIIHHGPHANQHTKFYINDMHTKSLRAGKLSREDLNAISSLDGDRDKQEALINVYVAALITPLDQASVQTQRDANITIRVIDGALEYALNEATNIGSYMQRLDYTDANVVTMGENVQSAESVIRDADMAKEMTEYTKNNVLQQAAQAMLAQANQNGSAVLSLLQ